MAPDHVGGNDVLRRKYGVTVRIHKLDFRELAELDEETLPPNITLRWRLGGVCRRQVKSYAYVWAHAWKHLPAGKKLVITGDTLFAGGIGRTNFPGSSNSDMKPSLQSLLQLPDGLIVYPGHGPATMIGEERQNNPFLLCL